MDDVKDSVKQAIKTLTDQVYKDDFTASEIKDIADATAKLSVTLHNLTVVEDQETHLKALKAESALPTAGRVN